MAQSGVLQFSSMAYSVKESGPLAKITVSRIGGSAGEVSVNFATSDGTAIAGEDYIATNGTLTFGPGVTSRSFYVPILNDLKHELNETVTIDLEPTSGINNATLTITDNDPCVFSIVPLRRLHGPEAGNGTITVVATEGCDWVATGTVDWLSAFPVGNGEVQYSLDANLDAASRTATIQIADKVFTVTQQGVFVPVAGSYNGLFHEESEFHHESSGLLSVKVTELGRFTGKIVAGGKRSAFSGIFALDGNATNAIVSGTNSLTVVLSLHLTDDSDQITGYITDNIWTASLIADRAQFHKTNNKAPQAGRYTLIVRGDDEEAAEEPGGDSFGTVTVDAGGNAKLSLTLADGTKATQKIPLSKSGEWPLYVPLYRGGGSILSRVAFADIEDESDFAGILTWIKPVQTTAKYYSEGIAAQVPLVGSLYSPPTNRTDRLLTFSLGSVVFTAGNLASAFTNAVSYSDDNKVLNLASNKMTLTISLPTGLFAGSVMVPGGTRSTPFKGALFQKTDIGSGFFLGTNESGRVLLFE